MKRGYEIGEPVIVHWFDAWTDSSYPLHLQDAGEYGQSKLPVESIGFLLEYNSECIVITEMITKRDLDTKKCKIITHIPTGMIEKVEKLKKYGRKKAK
jgi:hypothetical protein